jgi:hypothetical protein
VTLPVLFPGCCAEEEVILTPEKHRINATAVTKRVTRAERNRGLINNSRGRRSTPSNFPTHILISERANPFTICAADDSDAHKILHEKNIIQLKPGKCHIYLLLN